MKDQISIIGIKGYGHHGVLESERKNGQDFIVDLNLNLSLQQLKDDLNKTVDYSKLVEMISFEISNNPVNLIETLAERIAVKVLSYDQKIDLVSVTVHKPSAPVTSKVSDISVTVSKAR